MNSGRVRPVTLQRVVLSKLDGKFGAKCTNLCGEYVRDLNDDGLNDDDDGLDD